MNINRRTNIMNKIKILILFTILLLPTMAFSQTVNELFLQIPNESLSVATENRPKMITETEGELLKFRLSEARQGEVKIIGRKKDEIILGFSVNDCDSSSLQFWSVRKGVWKDSTNSIIKPLGENDVTAILKISPAAVSNPNQTLDIGYFYKFNAESTNLQLIARKQNSCEIAGTVYDYKFDGKKFAIKK
jgi:hypothetical protein